MAHQASTIEQAEATPERVLRRSQRLREKASRIPPKPTKHPHSTIRKRNSGCSTPQAQVQTETASSSGDEIETIDLTSDNGATTSTVVSATPRLQARPITQDLVYKFVYSAQANEALAIQAQRDLREEREESRERYERLAREERASREEATRLHAEQLATFIREEREAREETNRQFLRTIDGLATAIRGARRRR